MMFNRFVLIFALLFSLPAMAGTEVFDQSGNRVFTDLASLNQSLAVNNAAVTLTLRGQAKAAFQVTGTWVGTLNPEATIDGTNWFSVNVSLPTTGIFITTTSTNGQWQTDVSAYTGFRVRMGPYTDRPW
jgi:hypothetical protein